MIPLRHPLPFLVTGIYRMPTPWSAHRSPLTSRTHSTGTQTCYCQSGAAPSESRGIHALFAACVFHSPALIYHLSLILRAFESELSRSPQQTRAAAGRFHDSSTLCTEAGIPPLVRPPSHPLCSGHARWWFAVEGLECACAKTRGPPEPEVRAGSQPDVDRSCTLGRRL